jgi:hypothetical protein
MYSDKNNELKMIEIEGVGDNQKKQAFQAKSE